MTEDDPYDYRGLESEFRAALKQLEGRTLREVVLQSVEGEINVVLLVTDAQIFSVEGAIGGELLRLVLATPPEVPGSGPSYEQYEPATSFLGTRIVQARPIGEAWNGHGLELSFEGLPDNTLIIQSIYSGDAPSGFHDCLRVGVANYSHACARQPVA